MLYIFHYCLKKSPHQLCPFCHLKMSWKVMTQETNVWLIGACIATFINMLLGILFAKYILLNFFSNKFNRQGSHRSSQTKKCWFSLTVSTLFDGHYLRNHGWCLPIEAYCQEYLLRIWRRLMINCERGGSNKPKGPKWLGEPFYHTYIYLWI